MRFVAGFLQPIGVAFGVTEAQRIGGHLRQFDAGKAAFIEGIADAFEGTQSQVKRAGGGHFSVREEITMGDTLLAGRKLGAEIFRHLASREQRADLGTNVFGEPVHACTRAPRTPVASSCTWSSTARTNCGLPRFAAMVLHRAEPTTAASAMRTASAACAGER